MSAAVPVSTAPAVARTLAVASAPGVPETTSAEGAVGVSEASFGDVLEQQMQAAPSGEASSVTVAAPADSVRTALEGNPQGIDPNGIASDVLAALLASRGTAAAPGGSMGPTGNAIPQGESPPAAVPSLPETPTLAAVMRASQAKAALAEPSGAAASASLGVRGELVPVGPAAIGADGGKGLPLIAADSAAASRPGIDPRAAPRPEMAASAAAPGPAETNPSPPAPGVSLTAAPHGAAPAPEPRTSVQVPVPLGRPEWPAALGERISWLVGNKVQVADIQITPPQLGPVEVRITLQNDQATLAFVSVQPAVREAIQAALPRLGDLIAQSGVSLGQSSVGAESFAGGRPGAEGSGAGARTRDDGGLTRLEGSAPALAAQQLVARSSRVSGIDTYV